VPFRVGASSQPWSDGWRFITVIVSTDGKGSELRTEIADPQDAGPWQPGNALRKAASVLEADTPRAGMDPSARPDKVSGSLRALVVEDEPADVELVMRALRRAGFEATSDVAQTAEEFTSRDSNFWG